MKFKPFSPKYDFAQTVLIKHFPAYMALPIARWLLNVADSNKHIVYPTDGFVQEPAELEVSFKDLLGITLHENFPHKWSEFIEFLTSNRDRLCNVIALYLQNYAIPSQAEDLKQILDKSGSAYTIIQTIAGIGDYNHGGHDLVYRVSDVVEKTSSIAVDSNELLMEAWMFCYGRNPDYEKVVSRSCDFIESYIGKKYFESDTKPQLKKFVHALKSNPFSLSYKGDGIVNPKNLITDLLEKASDIRGQHTGGKGRKPTKNEAEFVLHTVIYIWNLHQQ